MAKPLRAEYPGAYCHEIKRGNAGENIFDGEREKQKFIEYISLLLQNCYDAFFFGVRYTVLSS